MKIRKKHASIAYFLGSWTEKIIGLAKKFILFGQPNIYRKIHYLPKCFLSENLVIDVY